MLDPINLMLEWKQFIPNLQNSRQISTFTTSFKMLAGRRSQTFGFLPKWLNESTVCIEVWQKTVIVKNRMIYGFSVQHFVLSLTILP